MSSYFLLWLGFFKNPFRGAEKGVPLVEDVPKTPIITFGTMGTTHSVKDYGAGRSGVNDTGALFFLRFYDQFVFGISEGGPVRASAQPTAKPTSICYRVHFPAFR